MLEELLARLEPGQAEHVQDQLVEPLDLLVDPFQEPAVDRLVVEGPVEQGLRVGLDRGQRGLELVRRVGDEVLPHPLEAAEVGDVVEDEHGPRRGLPGQGSAADRQDPRLAADGTSRPGERHLALVGIGMGEPERLLDRVLHLGAADQLGDEPADRRRRRGRRGHRRWCSRRAAGGGRRPRSPPRPWPRAPPATAARSSSSRSIRPSTSGVTALNTRISPCTGPQTLLRICRVRSPAPRRSSPRETSRQRAHATASPSSPPRPAPPGPPASPESASGAPGYAGSTRPSSVG